MKLGMKFITNIKQKEVMSKVNKATRSGLAATVGDIARDAIAGSPVDTGNNRRSIAFEVGPGKPIARKEGEGAVYSTSGYGGYLETGTVRMGARPYMKPALDKHIKRLPGNIKGHLR